MKTELECLPCFFRQVSRTLGHAGVNGDRGRDISGRARAIIEAASLEQAPARISTLLHRLIRETTGVDPYRRLKDASNRTALDKLPLLRQLISKASLSAGSRETSLEGGVRAAIAGNVIDFGIYESFDLERSLEESFRLPLPPADLLAFEQTVRQSDRILYLCDNAGEIALDRVLIDLLQERGKDVTVAVKGVPVINDATREDAEAAGIAASVRVIDNGNDGIGTLLEQCSEEFLDAYRTADMIISKGQANYETLAPVPDGRVFFLFKVKCPVVARFLARNDGDSIVMKNRGASAR